MAIEFFVVPTTTHSGSEPSEPAGASFDAFSYYSDDATRLRALLMTTDKREDDASHDDNASEGNAHSESGEETTATPERREARPRKTKISSELHPTLICEDFLFDDFPSRD